MSIFLLSACAVFPLHIQMDARVMSRDSGKVFTGKVIADGYSKATMDITISKS